MRKNLETEVAEAAAWLAKQDVSFGEIGVVFIIHDGVVMRVERSRVDKTQPAERQIDGGSK